MIRAEHALVADCFEQLHQADEVHIPIVRIDLVEIQEPALDVAQMDHKDLLLFAEVADDVEDLAARVG